MENRALTITKIILLGIIVILLTTILIVLLVKPNTGFNFFKIQGKSELISEKYIEEPVKKIKVITKAASVQIENNDTDKISVKYYAEKDNDDISITTENDLLKINDNQSYFCIGICNYAEHKIVISLPKEMEYDLDIITASGDVSVPEDITSNLNIKTVSGDIEVMNAKNVTLESTSGDIEINEATTLKVKTISGEVDINQIKKSCDIKTTSGDVSITLLELSTDSIITTVSGEVEIDSNRNSYVKTETVSGEVSVNNNDRYAKTELTIKTTSGDIEVGK